MYNTFFMMGTLFIASPSFIVTPGDNFMESALLITIILLMARQVCGLPGRHQEANATMQVHLQ
jgi:hypothetical protein